MYIVINLKPDVFICPGQMQSLEVLHTGTSDEANGHRGVLEPQDQLQLACAES